MRRRFIKCATLAAKLFVLCVIVCIICRNIDAHSLHETLADVHIHYIVMALGIMFLVPFIVAWRLAYIADVPPVTLFRCIIKSYFFNNFAPVQIGGDVYKIYYLSKLAHSKQKAAAFVVTDRVIGLSAALLLAIASLSIGYRYFSDDRIYASVFAYLSVVTVAYLSIFLNVGQWLQRIKWPRIIEVVLHKVVRIQVETKTTLPKKMLVGVAITLLCNACLVGVNICAMLALGLPVDVIASLLYIPVIALTVVTLPISLNGLGVRESLFILMFSMAGYTTEQSLAMALINLLATQSTVVAGAILFAIDRHKPTLPHTKQIERVVGCCDHLKRKKKGQE